MQPHRTVGGLLLFVALIGVVLTGGGSTAGAQDAPAIAGVDLTVLRRSAGATVVPVRVQVESLRAIEATLSITNENTNTAWEIPYALAANSAVEQILLVPAGQGSLRLDAELIAGGEVVASEEIRDDGREAPVNAVGVLGLDPPADEAQLVPTVGRASLIDLTDLGMLTALDTVVASPAGLRTLTPDELGRLQRWVAGGHQLVVADRAGSVDDLLPAEWIGEDSRVLADAGLLHYIENDWSTNLPPGISAAVDGQVMVGFFETSQAELLNDAGFRVPGIRALGLLLLLYLLLAGPVVFAVLNRMERQTLAWVVVPGLAVLFTAGVLVVGLFLTQGRGNGFAAIAEVGSAGASVTESVLIADDGRQELLLGPGWSLQSSGLSTSRESVGAPLTVRPALGSTELLFDIDPGGGGSAVVTGAAPDLDAALQIADLSVANDAVSGTLTNRSEHDLRGVLVLVGDRPTMLDELAAGASVPFTAPLGRVQDIGLPELRSWDVDPQNRFGFGGPRDDEAITDGPANGSAWIDWRASRLGTAAPHGMITAVGWSRDIDGRTLGGTGRTAIVARAHIPAGDGPLASEQIRTMVALAPDPSFGQFGFDGEVNGSTMVVQHVRPGGGDTAGLAVIVPRTASEARVWTGEAWQSLDLDGDNGELRFRIPDDLWADDTLWVEYQIADFFGEPGQYRTAMVSARDATEPFALLPAGERSSRDVFGGFDGPFGGDAVVGLVRPVELDSTGFFEGDGFLEGTYDEWTIDLRPGQSVRVWMDAPTNNFGPSLDPWLVIRDPDGRQIAENDDFNGLNSRVDFTADAAGEYVIETRPLSGFGGSEYFVRVETDPPEPEPATTVPEPTEAEPEPTEEATS